jgi:hypothetical protein
MMSGGCGAQFQLIMTNPMGTSPAYTARDHGLACGYSAASASAFCTEPNGPRPLGGHRPAA